MTASASGTAGNGQGPTGGAAGTAPDDDFVQDDGQGLKAPGVKQELGVELPKPQPKVEKPKEEAKVEDKKEPDTQPTEKDYRHAQQKITKEIESKMSLARKMVEKDADSIYDIAETDPKLAQKLLEEYEYGTKSLDELLGTKERASVTDDDVKERVLSTDRRLKKIEDKLTDERVLRMKEKHPDMKDDLEEKFRELYSDAKFSEEEPDKVLNVARALLGKPLQKADAQDVALDLLKQQEGVQTTLKGGSGAQKRSETPQSAAIRKSFGHSEADKEKYLPENFNEIMGFA